MSDEALWDVTDLAKYLKRSRRWVLRRLRREADDAGSIPHVKIGVEARFSPSVIRAWLEAGMPPASEMGRPLGDDMSGSTLLGTEEGYHRPPPKAM